MTRSDEASAAGTARGSKGQTTTDAAIVAQQATERKATATRAALAALAGIEARKLADGGWLVARWGQYRELDDDAAFDRWLAGMGPRA